MRQPRDDRNDIVRRVGWLWGKARVQRLADESARPDPGLQQAFGNQPVDGVDHSGARNADFLRQSACRRQPVAGGQRAGQKKIA